MNSQVRKKVYIGLSGGVDSSVSAALLKQQGYDVTGVFIKIWSPEWIECTSKKDRLDAMRVCAALEIPFKEIDMTEEYKKDVIDSMIDEYKRGQTPNPDVACNRYIKFGKFFDWAIANRADFVATGHYARIKRHGNAYHLNVARDAKKDQVYFLWTLTQAHLSRVLFPVGGMKKEEVRSLARKFKLPTAEKRDSQGLCFIGDVDIRDFLSRYIPQKPGRVVNLEGNHIGYHSGLFFLTIGERHGFTITKKTPSDEPYYIIAKDLKSNTLIVGRKHNVAAAAPKEVTLTKVNWIRHAPLQKKYRCQTHYHGQFIPCRIRNTKVLFEDSPGSIAPGQSLVLYDGMECLGGGVMGSTD